MTVSPNVISAGSKGLSSAGGFFLWFWFVLAGAAGFVVLLVFLIGLGSGPANRLLWRTKGILRMKGAAQASGEVLQIGETVRWENGIQREKLTVRVTPEGAPPFEAQSQALMDPAVAPRLQPGCTVQLRYDPAQPDFAVITDPVRDAKQELMKSWSQAVAEDREKRVATK